MISLDRANHWKPGKLWSLWDMLELEAQPFLTAFTQLRAVIVISERLEQTNVLTSEDRIGVAQHLGRLISEISKIGARSALAAANRLRASVERQPIAATYGEVRTAMVDIESRFTDHLWDIKLFVLSQQESVLMQSVDGLLSVPDRPIEGFSSAYPKASFEIEEASKCIALGRYTAAVFHCMRALECGIRALSALLEIEDATKPADKNWGKILEKVKDKINDKYPRNTRTPGSVGYKLESLYATLDAVRSPWRNASMHVEATYAPHEALHIARCTGMFLVELSLLCDEEGREPEDAPAMAESGSV